MKVITFYDLATGELGGVRTLPAKAEVKAQDGYGFILGRFDRMSQRFDLGTRQVVDHQPPKPDDDHEWRAENPRAADRVDQRWRWLKTPEVIQRELRSAHLLRQIENIEQLQLRSISDLLDDPNDAEARANYDRRKAEIARLRQMRGADLNAADRTDTSER